MGVTDDWKRVPHDEGQSPPLDIWYLSFADANKPKGQRWLGSCFVIARDVGDAASEAWKYSCNPGGQVMGLVIPKNQALLRSHMYRLLNSESLITEAIVSCKPLKKGQPKGSNRIV